MKMNSNNNFLVGGVSISHPDRILKPTKIVSKKQIADYYDSAANYILPYIINRPLVMYRCPEGQTCFFQKHYATYFPREVHKISIKENNSQKKSEYIMIKNKKGLISLVQFSTLELHPWGALYNNTEKPDQITLDLDPDKNTPWKKVIKTAFLLRDIVEQLNLISFVKTSGGKGLHIVIPIRRTASWDDIKTFSHNLALYIIHAYPEAYTDNPLIAKRKNKIFIDYLRNGRGSTSVAAYSTRAKPLAPISTPITWSELSKLKSADQYNISNIMKRLTKLKEDPWDGFFNCKQTLPKTKI